MTEGSHPSGTSMTVATEYPIPPIRIRAQEGGPINKSFIAEDCDVLETSVGITSFTLFVFDLTTDLTWMTGKNLVLRTS
jgi:hypothetical protein